MNKIIHKIVFNQPVFNKLFYEFEKKVTENQAFERIIISGLARSGTTSLLRELVKNDWKEIAANQLGDLNKHRSWTYKRSEI